ncbi:hypothetical protein AURDEDRAFT_110962 [Auricularia subglabra TFB-10046 SS5]|nr:hypothetical protein AURDEDRAFT_110962 [Auricularia subglabra TFB-10046 SS5]
MVADPDIAIITGNSAGFVCRRGVIVPGELLEEVVDTAISDTIVALYRAIWRSGCTKTNVTLVNGSLSLIMNDGRLQSGGFKPA